MLRTVALIALALAAPPAAAVPPGLAVIDFGYVDTSGEAADQTAVHRQRLDGLMAGLRRDLASDGEFRLVTIAAGTAPADLLRGAAAAGAVVLVTGGVHKMSTLVQWAQVQAVDVATGRVVLDRLFTFRGDSDEAWARAEPFMAEEIRTALAPVPLALFDFELEDASAGASSTGEISADSRVLAGVTGAVRQLLAQSGRYRLVDVGGADAPAVQAHRLHDCNGCDAALALRLGADQSFVGVVRRVSRTEYTVQFRLRDARTGAVLVAGDTGLRMGADYSWDRGAIRLVKDRLLGGSD